MRRAKYDKQTQFYVKNMFRINKNNIGLGNFPVKKCSDTENLMVDKLGHMIPKLFSKHLGRDK